MSRGTCGVKDTISSRLCPKIPSTLAPFPALYLGAHGGHQLEDIILWCSLQTLGGRLLGPRLDCIAPEAFTSEDKSFSWLRAALPLHAEYSCHTGFHSRCRRAVWEMLGVRWERPLSSASGSRPRHAQSAQEGPAPSREPGQCGGGGKSERSGSPGR